MTEESGAYFENGLPLKELLVLYKKAKDEHQSVHIEEEDFEKLADYFDEEDKIKEAIEVVLIGLSHYPYSAGLMIKYADMLIVVKEFEKALQTLEQASLYDSSNINIYILKTDALLALDQQAAAIDLLSEALNLFDGEDKIELLFELADVYDDYEQFDKVFDCLKLILEQEPANEEALFKIGFWSDYADKNEESIILHQKIIDDNPYNEKAWYNLGLAFQSLKLYEKSIDAFHFSLAINEKSEYAYRNIAKSLIQLKKYKEAIENLEKLFEITPPDPVTFEIIAYCYLKLNNTAMARFFYKKAIHLAPAYNALYFQIGTTYTLEEKWGLAIKYFETAIEINNAIPAYYVALGNAHTQLKQYDAAVAYLTKGIQIKPKNIASWEALIKCLIEMEAYSEANRLIEIALSITEGKPIFLFYFSVVCLLLNKEAEAWYYLEKGMQKAPRLWKKIVRLYPNLLSYNQFLEIIALHKKTNKQ